MQNVNTSFTRYFRRYSQGRFNFQEAVQFDGHLRTGSRAFVYQNGQAWERTYSDGTTCICCGAIGTERTKAGYGKCEGTMTRAGNKASKKNHAKITFVCGDCAVVFDVQYRDNVAA